MSYILVEYRCRRCGDVVESLESRSAVPAQRSTPHGRCRGVADRVLSAPAIKVQYGAVTTGKSDPPPPGALDTRALAEGMSMSEFKAMRSKKRRDQRRAWLKSQL